MYWGAPLPSKSPVAAAGGSGGGVSGGDHRRACEGRDAPERGNRGPDGGGGVRAWGGRKLDGMDADGGCGGSGESNDVEEEGGKEEEGGGGFVVTLDEAGLGRSRSDSKVFFIHVLCHVC